MDDLALSADSIVVYYCGLPSLSLPEVAVFLGPLFLFPGAFNAFGAPCPALVVMPSLNMKETLGKWVCCPAKSWDLDAGCI